MAKGLSAALLAGALAAAGPAQAGGLEKLRDALLGLADDSAIKARLDRNTSDDVKGDDVRTGATTVLASIDSDGLHVVFPDAQLRQAEKEHAEPDPDKPQPVSRGLRSIDPVDVRALLGYSKRLLADLNGATLLGEAAGSHDGVPATVLELQMPVKLDKGDRKHIKHASSVMKIWCGADGLPLALEEHSEYKGRIFLIIGFEVHESHKIQFAHSGTRLVVLRAENNEGGSGLGESGEHTDVTTVRLL